MFHYVNAFEQFNREDDLALGHALHLLGAVPQLVEQVFFVFLEESVVEDHFPAIFLFVKPPDKDLPVFGRHQFLPKHNSCLHIHLLVGVPGHLGQQFEAVLDHPAPLGFDVVDDALGEDGDHVGGELVEGVDSVVADHQEDFYVKQDVVLVLYRLEATLLELVVDFAFLDAMQDVKKLTQGKL